VPFQDTTAAEKAEWLEFIETPAAEAVISEAHECLWAMFREWQKHRQ